MAAMPATARGPEKDWLPLPAATVRTIAKTAPQAAPSRESVGLFIFLCLHAGGLRELRRYERRPGRVFGRGGEVRSAARGKSGSPGRRMCTGASPLYRRSHEEPCGELAA